MRLGWLGALALVVSLASAPALAGYAEGETAFNNGDYQGALDEFMPMATQGDSLAQSWVGYIYEMGLGDDASARQWYETSANLGEAFSQNKLGEFYRDGRGGLAADGATAAVWFGRAGDQNNGDALANLAALYRLGDGVALDYDRAFALATRATELGNASGENELGFLYENGYGVGQDYAEAFRHYSAAAGQGLMVAHENLGYLYENGLGVDLDLGIAQSYYAAAAAEDYSYSQYRLGAFYRDGLGGLPQDGAQAEQWLRAAAEGGIVAAQYELGDLYDAGTAGVTVNVEEAFYWYGQAAEGGQAEAQLKYGRYYENGWSPAVNLEEAARWYQAAAEQGNAEAASELGDAYYYGYGVVQDYATAAQWFRSAADGGDAYGQYNLGYVYEHGEGIEPDMEQAVLWYRLSGMQGHFLAEAELGDLYAEGAAVQQDWFRALLWYELSARQDYTYAQLQIANIYRDGTGIDADPVIAYVWYRLAERSDQDNVRSPAMQGRQMVEARMRADDRDTAESFVASWESGGTDGYASFPGDIPQADAISIAQGFLRDLGYYQGEADGVAGQGTQDALTSFAADYSVPYTDRVTPHILVALGEAAVVSGVYYGGAGAGASDGSGGTTGGETTTAAVATDGGLRLISTGSGFFVTQDGRVVTNHHVIEGCTEVRVSGHGKATIKAFDAENDLALLKLDTAGSAAIAFRDGTGIRPGDSIVVVGFPLQGLITSDMNVTAGIVNALAGMGNDRRFLQIQAPVQGGNSGGPLLDMSGNVVGVIVSKMNDIWAAENLGEIPQNVNFAINGWAARAFLDANGVRYTTSASNESMPVPDIADRVRDSTLMIECWQ